jgi:4-alpha-glucanotransferase
MPRQTSLKRPWLNALAVYAGIVPKFVDTAGQTRRAAESTQITILRALGLEASTEAAARRALAAEREAQERLLAATVLVPEQRAHSVRLPRAAFSGSDGSPLQWAVTIELEGGQSEELRGTLRRQHRSDLVVRLGEKLPLGYHSLHLQIEGRSGQCRELRQRLIVHPQQCTAPQGGGTRRFGISANLYTLRSARNWGIGDFGDLRGLADWSARVGAAFVGVNPLAALDPSNSSGSPYSPSSRFFRSPLYLDVAAIPELRQSKAAQRILDSAPFRRILETLRQADEIDYLRVWQQKRAVFEKLHTVFRKRPRNGRRDQLYERFRRQQGGRLELFATFCALQEHFVDKLGASADWQSWPAAFRDRNSSAVAAFRRKNARRVDFHRYLQFELDRQHAGAAGAAGLSIGLLHDLPLGSARGGADTWSDPELYLTDVEIGAPPDSFAQDGQSWALPPMHPGLLRERGFADWACLLRAALRHAGALRIDHVMGLFRQFWIPRGRAPHEGAYVTYPAAELLAVLALESRRAGAVVIGEDLGTVAPEVRPTLARSDILSTRVLYFERTATGGFRPSRLYPERCLATANTHDLVPLAGFWCERDLHLRSRGWGPASDSPQARSQRAVERRSLLRRVGDRSLSGAGPSQGWSPRLCGAVHDLLLATPARLVALSLDDLCGEVDPVNLPGTSPQQYPSWKRRMTLSMAEIRASTKVREALGRTRQRRDRSRKSTDRRS